MPPQAIGHNQRLAVLVLDLRYCSLLRQRGDNGCVVLVQACPKLGPSDAGS